MKKFKQNKLWKDKAVDLMEQNYGSKIHWQRLDDKEFNKEIKKKLLEEVQEVILSKNKKELIEELADVYEVISSLIDLHDLKKEEIIALQLKKKKERGGFTERKFVTIAEHLPNSFGEKYCLADLKKIS